MLADELHCCVWWQFRQRRELGGGLLCVLASVSAWDLNWTHSCTGMVQQNPGPELSPDRCRIKAAWTRSLRLKVDPLLQTPSEQRRLCHSVKQPVCKQHITEILKMKSTIKSNSAVFQRRAGSSANSSASSSCHCHSTLPFSHFCLVQDSIVHLMGD